MFARCASTFDEEVGDAKLSCGLSRTCQRETRANVGVGGCDGGWRAVKDKTHCESVTPAATIGW